jgi:polynucleotide 5'-hydroxyl-kinase GRC3/NOL9
MGEIESVPLDWVETAEKIKDKKIIFTIGGVDSGKTTFITFLANYFLKNNVKTAVLDSDIGQSDIGPPTTIGWGIVENYIEKMSDIKCKNFYFIGSITPESNELEMIIGIRKMCDEAIKNAQKVLIDTTGMVSGKAGKILKRSKIEILNPDVIICFQKENEREIREIVSPYLKNKNIEIFFLKIPQEIKTKTREERRLRREESFKKYFSGCGILEINYIDKIFLLPNYFEIDPTNLENFKNMLICLISKDGIHIALGIILEIDLFRKKILLKTPYKNSEEIYSLKFSNFFLSLE